MLPIIYIFIAILFVVVCIKALKMDKKNRIYTQSTVFDRDSFPRQIYIINNSDRRLIYDKEILKLAAERINTQFGSELFRSNVLVQSKENLNDKSALFVYFEAYTHTKDHKAFDGPLGTLAHSVVGGNVICFDYTEAWTPKMFLIVCLHEMLHSLGLHHSDDKNSIMEPKYKKQSLLGESDVANLRDLFPFFMT